MYGMVGICEFGGVSVQDAATASEGARTYKVVFVVFLRQSLLVN
jgi:hypothetical protein